MTEFPEIFGKRSVSYSTKNRVFRGCRNSLSRAPVTRRAPGLQVWNRVGKITDFGLKWGKGFKKRAATPQFFWGYAPRNFWDTKGRSLCQAFLVETVETETKNLCVIEPRMFCEESLEKIKVRAFPKRIVPRILSLESVDYFGTSVHYWVVEKKNLKNLN